MNLYKTLALKNSLNKICILFLLLTVAGYSTFARSTVIPTLNYDTVSNFFAVVVNGKKLATAKYKDVHYASFQQEGKVTISVTSTAAIKAFTISPLSKNVLGKLIGNNTIQFALAKPSYFVIKVNNERLFLFAEKPVTIIDPHAINISKYKVDPTGKVLNTSIQQAIDETSLKKQQLYFPAGIYKTGRLVIPSNANLFFASGALIKASDELSDMEAPGKQRSKGFLNILDAKNVRIAGLGVIDGNGRKLRDKYGDQARIRLLFISHSKNVSINGITERDPGSWNTQIMYSNDVAFKNVKQVNDVALSNTDGFDPDASSHVTIEDCFGYCGDDNVAIKITQQDSLTNVTSDITVKGCVFLTRKSSLKVGTESRGITIKNVLFENNDVIMSDRGMALYCSDGALYDNIKYNNNHFEENYPDAKRMSIHFYINKRNPDSRAGVMRNVVISNCTFYKAFPKPSEIQGLDETHNIQVSINNLVVDGKNCASLEQAGIKASFANVQIK
jgi:hypothetical protein